MNNDGTRDLEQRMQTLQHTRLLVELEVDNCDRLINNTTLDLNNSIHDQARAFAKCDIARRDNERTAQELESAIAELEDSRTQLELKEHDFEKAKQELEEIREKLRESESKKDRLRTEKDAVQSKITVLNGDIRLHRTRLQQLSHERQSLKDQLARTPCTLRLEKYSDAFGNISQNVANPKIKVLNDSISLLNERIDTLEKKLREEEGELEKLKTFLRKVSDELDSLLGLVDEQTRKFESSRHATDRAREYAEKARIRVTEADRKVNSLQRKLNELERMLKQLENGVSKADEAVERLEEEIFSLKSDKSYLERELESYDRDISDLEHELATPKQYQEHSFQHGDRYGAQNVPGGESAGYDDSSGATNSWLDDIDAEATHEALREMGKDSYAAETNHTPSVAEELRRIEAEAEAEALEELGYSKNESTLFDKIENALEPEKIANALVGGAITGAGRLKVITEDARRNLKLMEKNVKDALFEKLHESLDKDWLDEGEDK